MYIHFHSSRLRDTVEIGEFIHKIHEIDKATDGIREFGTVVKEINILLYVHNIKDNRLKVLKKLSPNAKYGFISEFLIKSCHEMNVPLRIISKYKELKESYDYYKTSDWAWGKDKLPEIKDKLGEMTKLLLDVCVYDWNKSKIRENKLNSLLEV